VNCHATTAADSTSSTESSPNQISAADEAIDPAVMPDGARVGQVICHAEAGTTIVTTHFTQFDDTCNHLHIDVGFTDGTLTTN
jgi:hypothetical protein